jgi:hypothetical protein
MYLVCSGRVEGEKDLKGLSAIKSGAIAFSL